MIPPDFGTWQEELRFVPGTRVRVVFPGQYFGREATVIRYLPKTRVVEITSLHHLLETMTATTAALEVIDDPS